MMCDSVGTYLYWKGSGRYLWSIITNFQSQCKRKRDACHNKTRLLLFIMFDLATDACVFNEQIRKGTDDADSREDVENRKYFARVSMWHDVSVPNRRQRDRTEIKRVNPT